MSQLFLRGMPHLHKRMKRTHSKKAPMESRHQHPNFYKMPLPDDPNTNMAKSNKVDAFASSSFNPPSPNVTGSRNDVGAQVHGGIPQIQGTCKTASSLYHPHHAYSCLERNALQLPVTDPHILMQGLQQSMSQSNSQQSARMFPPNIVWNPSSNIHFLAPSTASALTAAASFASAPNPLPIVSFPTNMAPNLAFSPRLFQPQHPSQHQQHLHLPVHLGAHALSQQPTQSQNASSITTSSQSQDPIEQCRNYIPPSHPTQTQFLTNLPSYLPTLQYQNPMAARFPGGNSNNTQDLSTATTSFNLMAGRGQQPDHYNNGDANGL
mmetsp:Transcript_3705/g.7868  ORF Transcript_3705/g.7868 Transcript_3705/m.7868 type:complete len:322 (-) Transcript_3705:492-1457(-)|eukprot:CAMPEP_0171340508 /NCGR_PEP_ID=MMETSP0878-20121228/8619_1 /TAXON_ID=67004 /ORGANISM="Thalassiosira weissflogii, Strain CCMP1336" /LENGTH=321 /DNA_ID=CAMNT_0011842591 /DNA_START=868 /DNA_END=1833 /DNA_ORIENTATION=-